MKITGIHLLLTYQCTHECDHCFVWGSPWQVGTMDMEKFDQLLDQAIELGTVAWFYFEGGEPFLYYVNLVNYIQRAASAGFKTGIVSNSYWAIGESDAIEWLKPFQGLIQDLSISNDRFHWNERDQIHTQIARRAAEKLGIPIGFISVAQPEEEVDSATGQLPIGESGVMFRGRAAQVLAPKASPKPWDTYTECPYENLRDPGRVHVDPLGNVHVCQGISIGNIFDQSLKDVVSSYDPDAHPVTTPILSGGPHELVLQYDLLHEEQYVDACHLCDDARRRLRSRFPSILTPDQMYCVPG